MATNNPTNIGGSDPSVLRQIQAQNANLQTRPGVSSPPVVGGTSTTPVTTGATLSLAPVVSGSEVLYPQSTTATNGDAVTITSSVNNDSGDVTTVYTSNGQITVNPINQTVNYYTSVDSGVSQIVAGTGVTISSTGNNGTGVVTINATGGGGGGDYGNSNVAAYLPTYTGNVGAGNVNTTGTVYTSGISSTGLASLTILNVSTTANLGAVGNVRITGGTSGQKLTTDGAGNLSWTNDANSSYGNSNVVTLLSAFGSNNISTTGNVSIGNLNVSGNVTSDLLPNANVTHDLGSPTQRWKDIWLANSTIYLGEIALSVSNSGQLSTSEFIEGGEGIGGIAYIEWTTANELSIRTDDVSPFVATFESLKINDSFTLLTGGNGVFPANTTIFVSGAITQTTPVSGFIDFIIPVDDVPGSNVYVYTFNLTRAPITEFSQLTGNTINLGNTSITSNGNSIVVDSLTVLSSNSITLGNAIISSNGNTLVVDSIEVTNGNIGTIGNIASLNLDGSNSNVLYGNGVFAPAGGGGGGNTGNVTFDNVTVQGVNGLNLSAGSDFTANLAYLQVRAGDVASHIHLDTGNNQAYDLILGDDQNYVQVSSTGNILLSAYDSNTNQYTWTLDYNGNLILAGGNSVIQSIANSSLDPLNPNVSTMVLTPDQGYSSQALVLDPTAPGHIHLRAPGANIDEPYANLFLGGETSSFEVGASYGVPPNVFIHSGGNTWTFATDGNLIFPRDANINTDPYLRINGGATPTIISEDTSLAGPANLSIVSDYLTLQGYSESITIRNNDGTFSGSPNLSLSLNAYDDGDSPTVQLINWNSSSGFPTTIVSSETDQVALTTNVNSPNPYSWTFDNTGTLTVPGNLVAVNASPAPVISGFSSVSALQFTNGNSNVTINANSNIWTFDSTGNLIIPGTSGGVIKTVANGAIAIAAIDNGSDNPAQLVSFNANGTPTTAISSYANQATIQANINGSIKTWAFTNTGNLTLPGNTIAINFANGSSAFGNLIQWITAPVANTSAGTAGQAAYDSGGNLYVCVATNTWAKFTGTTSW